MATSVDKGEIDVAEKEIQLENKENHEEIVSVELPAPNGWKKKFIPKKGGTPKRNEIVFISPTGEEIKHKRQLDLFLKAHPGGPPSSEFDWGTGDTPRRSARISEKSKATETPEHEPVKKRERKSSSKKGTKEDGDDGDGEAPKEEQAAGAVDESNASPDVEMKETENGEDTTVDEAIVGEAVAVQKDGGDKTVDEVTTGEVMAVQQDGGDKTVDEKVKTGESVEVQQDAEDKNEETTAEKVDKPAEANSKIDSDSKDNPTENNSLAPPAADSNKESEAPTPLSGFNEVEASAKKETEVAVGSSENDGKLGDVTSFEKEVKTGEVLPDNSSHKEIQAESKPMETNSVNCEEAQHQPKTPPVSC